MSGNFRKEDLRVLKTRKYLCKALESMLDRRNFKQVTVNDLCEEALISRAAFYSHFRDKYDLLASWLSELAKKHDAVKNESMLEYFIYDNSKWIKNIICEADSETRAIIHDFTVIAIEHLFEKNSTDKTGVEFIVLSNICAGGLMHFLSWQMDHRYPCELQMTKTYLHSLLENIIKWDAHMRHQPEK